VPALDGSLSPSTRLASYIAPALMRKPVAAGCQSSSAAALHRVAV
jgi:hypothetical protein